MGATMKLYTLKQWVQNYDNRKGWRRRLFGDALQIKVLKQLISTHDGSFQEITLQNYRNFAIKYGYDVDLSAEYLNSNRASAIIFKLWANSELAIRNAIRRVTLFYQSEPSTPTSSHHDTDNDSEPSTPTSSHHVVG